MIAEIETVCFTGIQSVPITVQVQMASGSLPSFQIVGLPDKAVNESRERIRSALYTLGIALPAKRIIINLSPANIQKEGTHYDLPIALALMHAIGILPEEVTHCLAMGELGLDGSLKPVHGTLCAALYACEKKKTFICPRMSAAEAGWAGGVHILAPAHLLNMINHFKGTEILESPTPQMEDVSYENYGDFAEIRGHETAKRALSLAAAGRHNVVMVGPPGTGKSMLAQRLMSIMPPLLPQEALEVTMIHSIANLLKEGMLCRTRPFRNPHHSVSIPALVGGGLRGGPGEISLAHCGVLFLDELPEFPRTVLDALRQSLESKTAVVSRANYRASYPANFQLIAGMNPCRCGYLGIIAKQCHKAPSCATNYQQNLSGPFLDRIDIFISVPEMGIKALVAPSSGPQSAFLRDRVKQAIVFAEKNGSAWFTLPAEWDAEIHKHTEAETLLLAAVNKLHLSMRSYYRTIKLARTIANMELSDSILRVHMAEALSYREQTLLC